MGGTNEFDMLQIVADNTSDTLDVVKIFSKPFDVLWGSALVNNIFTITSTVGVLLMLVYFFIDLEDIAVRQNFTAETFVKNLAKLIIGISVVSNIGWVIQWVVDFGNGIFADLAITGGTFELTPTFNDAGSWANFIKNSSSFSEAADNIAIVAVVYFFKLIAFFVLWSVSIKRAIEIGIYYAMSPIIYADVFSNGITGVVQKLKPFLGLMLQLPYVMILISLGNVLVDRSYSFITTSSSILLTFIVLKTVMSSVSSSKDELERFLNS